MELLNLIKQMEDERRQANRLPRHVLLNKLLIRSGMQSKELSKALDELRDSGMIETGRTINDDYIKSK